MDLNQLGLLPGGHDHTQAGAVGDEGAGVDHVPAVGHRGAHRQGHFVLGDGKGLARQRRLVDPQLDGLDEPEVRRDLVAGLDDRHVAGHHLDR
ncbi:MAG TPA: hypothetical protein VFN60_08130, partial [Acidimicrobiales bacterium]|nr:hypothetical protein [Acidimicrobiales bacterium]